MAELLRRAATGSWKEALLNSSEEQVQRTAATMLNLDRANWYRLTDLSPTSRVLDIGAGIGTTSHALANRFREIVALEPVFEAVEFMRHRFAQEHLDNVTTIRSSVWEIPFRPASFDLVVMNGVLPWIAGGRDGDPRRLQQAALSRACQLLRPGGYLYLGVENRMGWQYWLGQPDVHCGLRYVSILPRPLASWYAKRMGHVEGYRTYTYSIRGYRKLLEKAGLTKALFYLAIPSYNAPRFYVPLDENIFSYYTANFDSARSGSLRRVAHWALAHTGILKYLQGSFAILAKRETERNTALRLASTASTESQS